MDDEKDLRGREPLSYERDHSVTRLLAVVYAVSFILIILRAGAPLKANTVERVGLTVAFLARGWVA